MIGGLGNQTIEIYIDQSQYMSDENTYPHSFSELLQNISFPSLAENIFFWLISVTNFYITRISFKLKRHVSNHCLKGGT